MAIINGCCTLYFALLHVYEVQSKCYTVSCTRIADAYRWHETDIQYDVISLLNVLDRCSHPIDLLMSIKRRLVPGTGRLILAVVFPFRPYVESSELIFLTSIIPTASAEPPFSYCCV